MPVLDVLLLTTFDHVPLQRLKLFHHGVDDRIRNRGRRIAAHRNGLARGVSARFLLLDEQHRLFFQSPAQLFELSGPFGPLFHFAAFVLGQGGVRLGGPFANVVQLGLERGAILLDFAEAALQVGNNLRLARALPAFEFGKFGPGVGQFDRHAGHARGLSGGLFEFLPQNADFRFGRIPLGGGAFQAFDFLTGQRQFGRQLLDLPGRLRLLRLRRQDRALGVVLQVALTFGADDFGGIEGEYDLPNDAALGVYQLLIPNLGGGNFRVEEYKKPEFEVLIDAPKEPCLLYTSPSPRD